MVTETGRVSTRISSGSSVATSSVWRTAFAPDFQRTTVIFAFLRSTDSTVQRFGRTRLLWEPFSGTVFISRLYDAIYALLQPLINTPLQRGVNAQHTPD